MADEQSEVLDTNASFYTAFAGRDYEAMEALWSSASVTVCVHPGWPPIRGREEVMKSFRSIFEHDTGPSPTCEAPTCHVIGTGAFVVCRERLGNAVLIATNVYARESGQWRLVHHHASALAQVPATPELDSEMLPN
ncbi:MAG: nuclear transport factor 2 family protein [Nannocystaceae bacterium]|nr:nuclear transport factor 2 family protein [Nannocystaceae bacterium]